MSDPLADDWLHYAVKGLEGLSRHLETHVQQRPVPKHDCDILIAIKRRIDEVLERNKAWPKE